MKNIFQNFKTKDWIIILLVIVLLFLIFGSSTSEGFGMGGGAKFKISGRKDKCACCRNCDILYNYCITRPATYTRDYCDLQRWACKKTCKFSDYGS